MSTNDTHPSDEGAADVADEAPQNLQQRLMAEGHEMAEGYFCTICFLPIELPSSQHSTINGCCMKRLCNGCVLAAEQPLLQDAPPGR